MVAPSHGARLLDDGTTRFALWAPSSRSVAVELANGDVHALEAQVDGWFSVTLPCGAGTNYRFIIEDRVRVPDPASRAQVDGVHGWSQVVDPRHYAWRNPNWQGRPWHETILYEVHVGLLGGYVGVEAYLPSLVELGITAIELMPLGQFPGARNWGYDGVLPYAPQSSYGTPDALRSLIDTAHGLGLMVFVDVVYNHFGPDGNYLHEYAKDFFREDVHTPWGAAIDFRRPQVRDFFFENALMWLLDYQVDGLRLDAVHAINDKPFLVELAQRARDAVSDGRLIHLVLENEHNDADLLQQGFDAQWNDDGHNVLHHLLTGEREAYYAEFADDATAKLARCIGEGFIYQGEHNRRGETRGQPSAHLPPSAFVLFLQNHDQTGNRALGERLASLVEPQALRAATVLLLLSPMIPLLFMGEEWGSRQPFLFFTDHHEELGVAVREGRRAEFAEFAAFADPHVRESIPDPNAPATFSASLPDYQPERHPEHRTWRAFYRDLLRLRQAQIVPRLAGARALGVQVLGEQAISAAWQLGDGSQLRIDLNLADQTVPASRPDAHATLLFGLGIDAHPGHLPPYSAAAPATGRSMSDSLLAGLAQAAGISIQWVDANGRQQYVSPEAQRALLEALGYPAQSSQQISTSLGAIEHAQQNAGAGPLIVHEQGCSLELGQYFPAHTRCQIQLENGGTIDASLDADASLAAISECGYHRLLIGDQQLELAIAPPACPSLHELTGRSHAWGLTAQVYALRRPGDGGLGDTAALEALARSAAAQGADALAISPLHAMFSAAPDQYSPYSPSSRLFFNALHAAPDSLLGEDEVLCAIANCNLLQEWQRLEQLQLIDWPAVASARYRVLRRLHEQFAACAPAELTLDFARFRSEGGDALLQHCRFEALQGVMRQRGEPVDWRLWPEHYRDPQQAAVERFAIEHAREVDAHAFNQWLIARGLQRAQNAAREAGMGIGLIADLAVGADGAGSQAWTRQAELLPAVTVGAPPDILNRSGQAWGVSAFSPSGLRQHGYRAFIEMLRANLAHVGGVRIDHVMGLKRLWVIPQGAESREGAYLNYPLQDLLRLLALEASRHRALVIGEDLGTVPDGLREELARRHLLGMRVLLFEQSDGRFIAPRYWPRDALATTTTHDLPTLRGWFAGRDIEWRLQAGHCTPEQTEGDRKQRPWEAAALRTALTEHGELEHADNDEQCLDAAIGFIGKTPAPLVLLPLEDALGEREQANLPGPGDIHPNWRRRWSRNADELLEQPDARRRLARLAAARAVQGGADHD